jgi:6-carboxyhexanoate--CoA ligase
MHAERGSDHLSGAERLVTAERVEAISTELLLRAMAQSPGTVKLSVDEIDGDQIMFGSIPSLTLMPVIGYERGREQALAALIEAGVTMTAATSAMTAIAAGASTTGRAMRGAMLIDAESGDRLEDDPDRGVRATCLDLTEATAISLDALLHIYGLRHIRTREALVLAAKVMATPSIVAEVCWSDAPDYTAGYVASKPTGYLRFPDLKPAGDRRGGRAFFLRPDADLAATIDFLEQTPFLANQHGAIRALQGEL